jgi:hypothetical protein
VARCLRRLTTFSFLRAMTKEPEAAMPLALCLCIDD